MRGPRGWLAVSCLAALAHSPACSADRLSSAANATSLAFSKVTATRFPGGTYKAVSTSTFPISQHLSAALVALNAGGLREPHWHTPAEWAIVLSGACRAVALEAGKARPSDEWDYLPGDVWYFPANTAHSILGLGPSGCSYLAVFSDGAFDERANSFDLSKWVAALPPNILAQHLNSSVSGLAAQLPLANSSEGTADVRTTPVDGFIVQGPPSIINASAPALPLQTPLNSHRYALKSSNIAQVNVEGGGTVNFVDSTLFPIAKSIWGGILTLQPNALRVSHWHLNSDELQYVANGTDVEIGYFLESGELVISTLQNGDVGLAPQGAAHYLKNNGNVTADIVVLFNSDVNTGIDLSWTLGSFPTSWVAAALNTSTNATAALAKQYKPLTADIVPASLAVASQ